MRRNWKGIPFGLLLLLSGSPASAGIITVAVNGTNQADGSTLSHDFQSLIIGAANPTTSVFSLVNNPPPGQGGTVDLVTSGHATVTPNSASVANGSSNTALTVGINVSAVGARAGSILVPPISAPPGQASGDKTDTINVVATVLDHANASFNAGVDTNSLIFDFGSFLQGGPTQQAQLGISNLFTTLGFTADLDFDGITGIGDTGVFSTTLAPFSGLGAGSSSFFDVFFDLSTAGTFSAIYTLNLSDEDLPGATSQQLQLELRGTVEKIPVSAVPEPSSLVMFSIGGAIMLVRRVRKRQTVQF